MLSYIQFIYSPILYNAVIYPLSHTTLYCCPTLYTVQYIYICIFFLWLLNLFGPPGHIDTLQYFRCAGIVSGTPHQAVLDTLFTPTYILYNIQYTCRVLQVCQLSGGRYEARARPFRGEEGAEVLEEARYEFVSTDDIQCHPFFANFGTSKQK